MEAKELLETFKSGMYVDMYKGGGGVFLNDILIA